MKTPMHSVFALLSSVVLFVVLSTLAVWAQGGNPPASTKESGQTSGHGQTAIESGMEDRTTAAKETSLTGCLAGPNDEGVYTLSPTTGKKPVEVSGEAVDLKDHVGHQVKLTGLWAKSGTEIGEKEKEKHGKGEQHFKVMKLDDMANTCGAGTTKP